MSSNAFNFPFFSKKLNEQRFLTDKNDFCNRA